MEPGAASVCGAGRIGSAVAAALEPEKAEGVNEIRGLHLRPKDVLILASVDFRDDTRAARITPAPT